MLMRHTKQQMSLILLLSLFVAFQLTFAQLQLHPKEAAVLREIAATLGATLTNSTVDPCQSGILPMTDSYQVNNITCYHTDGIFSHITTIHLRSTSLQGRIPPELAKLTFLEELDLTRSYLSGELPKEWGSLRNLKILSVTAVGTSGKIPKEWGNLANLNFLSLESNQLSGTIPEELGNLVNLTELALSSNQFVGNLPITFAQLTNLKNFRISDNNFSGTVPEFIGRWTKLERLEMYSSGLEGPIDPTIFALGNLTDLVLRNLNMSGSISIDIQNIWEGGSMNTLDLSFNKLEGEITDYEAVNIFLSGNMLTGAIPNSMFHSTKKNIAN